MKTTPQYNIGKHKLENDNVITNAKREAVTSIFDLAVTQNT